jgi:hypothetical protein
MINWLASYPKSGNTWMRLLLAAYFRERDDAFDINAPGVTNGVAAARARFDEILGIDSAHLTDAEVKSLLPHVFTHMASAKPAPQWIKVHDAQARLPDGSWLFPPATSGKAVYIVRNPLDVAVSRAFHDGHEDMARAVEALCNPAAAIGGDGKQQLKQCLGDWSHHVRSWVDQSEIPVLTVRYEDMLDDAARELTRVIGFVFPDHPIDHARIEEAVANTAFDRLQSVEAAQGFRETTPRQKRFFRNGKAGGWVDHLTDEQVARVTACHRPVMRRFGYAD